MCVRDQYGEKTNHASLTSNCHQTHLVATSNTFILQNHSPPRMFDVHYQWALLLLTINTIKKEASISFTALDFTQDGLSRFLHALLSDYCNKHLSTFSSNQMQCTNYMYTRHRALGRLNTLYAHVT